MPVLMILLAIAGGDAAAVEPADWKAFAACSAAYEVNAQVADPARPAAMRTMVSDVAVDYRKAAEERLRKSGKLSAAGIRKAVAGEIARRAAEYRPKPRTDVERLIEACPQLPESD